MHNIKIVKAYHMFLLKLTMIERQSILPNMMWVQFLWVLYTVHGSPPTRTRFFKKKKKKKKTHVVGMQGWDIASSYISWLHSRRDHKAVW